MFRSGPEHDPAPARFFSGRRFLRRLRAETSGTTALEFGLVAAPFLLLMFAVVEVSLVFFGTFTLENGVEQAARLIRTGQVQQQGLSETQFKQAICDKASGIFNCMAKLKLDVQKFDNFAGSTNPGDPLNENGELSDDFVFDPGNGGDVVLVRAFYEWDIFTELPGGLGNMPNGSRLITASAAFRNEPFDQ